MWTLSLILSSAVPGWTFWLDPGPHSLSHLVLASQEDLSQIQSCPNPMVLHPGWWGHCPACSVVRLCSQLISPHGMALLLLSITQSTNTSSFPSQSVLGLYCHGGCSISGKVWRLRIYPSVLWIGIVVWSICIFPFSPWSCLSEHTAEVTRSLNPLFFHKKKNFCPLCVDKILHFTVSSSGASCPHFQWKDWVICSKNEHVQVVTFPLSYIYNFNVLLASLRKADCSFILSGWMLKLFLLLAKKDVSHSCLALPSFVVLILLK